MKMNEPTCTYMLYRDYYVIIIIFQRFENFEHYSQDIIHLCFVTYSIDYLFL